MEYEETNPEEEKEKIPSASITRSVLPVAKFEKIFLVQESSISTCEFIFNSSAGSSTITLSDWQPIIKRLSKIIVKNFICLIFIWIS